MLGFNYALARLRTLTCTYESLRLRPLPEPGEVIIPATFPMTTYRAFLRQIGVRGVLIFSGGLSNKCHLAVVPQMKMRDFPLSSKPLALSSARRAPLT